MGIDHRGPHVRMAEQRLDRADVAVRLRQNRREVARPFRARYIFLIPEVHLQDMSKQKGIERLVPRRRR